MDLLHHFQRQLEYNAWANREVASTLKALHERLASAERLLAHVIAAELLWLTRLEGRAPVIAVWPDFSLAECEQQIEESERVFAGYFGRELPAAFGTSVNYKNSKGESWSSRVEDILTHVFLHSAYHRGQIAFQMRQTGHAPAYTDFIHGVRQGQVK